MFIKVQVYHKGNKCCFEDILKSDKPWFVINTGQISSLGPKTDWGMCWGHERYPYRILTMCNGDIFLCVLESADKLEEKLLNQDNNTTKDEEA